MSDVSIDRVVPQVEILQALAREEKNPQVRMEIMRQMADLLAKSMEIATKQEELRQSWERFEWEKKDRLAREAYVKAFKKFKEKDLQVLKTKAVSFAKNFDPKKDTPAYKHAELDKAVAVIAPAACRPVPRLPARSSRPVRA